MLQSLVILQSCVAGGVASSNDRGATASEYSLIVALIAAATIGAVAAVGVDVAGLFARIGAAVDAL